MTQRLQWHQLPGHLKADIGDRLRSPVADFVSAPGGYSPALAGVATLADGRTVFVKAASPNQNPNTPTIMRTEARINRQIGGHRPPAPELLDQLDDGTWVVLIFEAIDGQPPGNPWTDQGLAAVLDAIEEVNHLPSKGLPTAADIFGPMFGGWNRLRDHDPAIESGRGSDSAESWWRPRLDQLCTLEKTSVAVVAGHSFVHADIRSDNTLIRPDGSAVFVDWTTCCQGASWLDIASMAASIAVEGGPQPQDLLARSGANISRDEQVAFVAGMSGYFVHAGRRPDPPGMSTVRDHQRDKGVVTTHWLRQLLDTRDD